MSFTAATPTGVADVRHGDQQEEWIPKSWKIGARGTLSRATAKKAGLFEQLIEEEADSAHAVAGRKEQDTTYCEVSIIECKDHRDGGLLCDILDEVQQRASGEGFHHLYEIAPGSGVHSSFYLYVVVGSVSTYVEQDTSITEDQRQQLKFVMKKCTSTIYLQHAPADMVELVAARNNPGKGKKQIYNITVCDGSDFRIAGGWRSIERLVSKAGSDIIVRVEKYVNKEKKASAAVRSALDDAFGQEYRLLSKPLWRLNGHTIGTETESNTPLAFINDADGVFTAAIIDSAECFAQDPILPAEAAAACESAEIYYAGPGVAAVADKIAALGKYEGFSVKTPKMIL